MIIFKDIVMKEGITFFGLYIRKLGELLKNNYSTELINLKYSEGRANLDLPLQKFIKKVIAENQFYKINGYDDMVIDVYCEDDYTDEIKNKIENFNNPDMIFKICMEGEEKYEKLELKSTKTNDVKGTSRKNIDPHEQLLIVFRKKDEIKIATGEYHNAVANYVPRMTDRSPRQFLIFTNLEESMYDKDYKSSYLDDDQFYNKIVEKTLDEVINTPNDKIDWYINYHSKFLGQFLNFYESLGEKDKLAVKEKLLA